MATTDDGTVLYTTELASEGAELGAASYERVAANLNAWFGAPLTTAHVAAIDNGADHPWAEYVRGYLADLREFWAGGDSLDDGH